MILANDRDEQMIILLPETKTRLLIHVKEYRQVSNIRRTLEDN